MTALIIANTQIRCDAAGRYCLNDLHQASGGASRHQPGNWLRLQQTQDLVAECAKSDEPFLIYEEREPVVVLQGGFVQGTYAVKELVYAYAMWISAAFHLHVIRAYDALVTVAREPAPGLLQHRADQLVGASRIFAAAFRAARTARLPYPQALQAAADCAQRHSGIDWREECGFAIPEPAPALPDPLRERVMAALAGRRNFQMAALIGEFTLGAPGDTGLMARIADIARSLGWRSRRRRHAQGGFFTEWTAPGDR